MGIFDKILTGLGFEGNEPQPKKVKKQEVVKDTSSYTGLGAEYNFSREKVAAPHIEEPESTTLKETNQGVSMKNPVSQEDIQNIIDDVKDGATIIVNLTGFSAQDRVRALDFLAGALYVLDGKLEPLEGNLYLVSIDN